MKRGSTGSSGRRPGRPPRVRPMTESDSGSTTPTLTTPKSPIVSNLPEKRKSPAIVEEKVVARPEIDRSKPGEPIIWTDENENKLIKLLLRYKPIGINKHFNMIIVAHAMSSELERKVEIKDIRKHIGTWYNLEEFEKSLIVPFPHKKQIDYTLPTSDKEIASLIAQKNLNKKPEEPIIKPPQPPSSSGPVVPTKKSKKSTN